MKTQVTTIIMLMSMIIGSLEASGQSARGERESARKATTVQRENPGRSSAVQRENRGRSAAVQRESTRRSSVSRHENNGRSPAVQRESSRRSTTIQRGTTGRSRTHSTTNRHNPRSNYGRSEGTVHTGKTYKNPRGTTPGNRTVERNEHTSSHGYATHHRHYYPRQKVKIHVHPRTYHHHYRVLYYPRYSEIVWTRSLNRYYIGIYPGYRWNYHYGYRIQSMSVFDARYNVGEIARVYGRVYGTWYNRESDNLLLFFGGEFPYQEFTMVVPGKVARRYSWRPERYFLGQHIVATGLITTYEGKPEMVIKRKRQLDVY